MREELDFAKSFLFLQKIRFENAIDLEINVDVSMLKCLVPPLTVQTLIENAFKHNKASSDNPLKIKIYTESNFLIFLTA